MYLRRLTITNVRSIAKFEMTFEKDNEPGWHVVLGHNGAGKSSVVRSFALLMMGEREAPAAGQVFADWIKKGAESADIGATVVWDAEHDRLTVGGAPLKKPIELQAIISREIGVDRLIAPYASVRFTGERHQRTVWGGGSGWFTASFGPFRRFSGGDPAIERSFFSNPRLAPHLSALTESVALREARRWLTDLQTQRIQDERNQVDSRSGKVIEAVVAFLNGTGLFPHGSRISEVDVNNVIMIDGNKNSVPMDEMSDGFRSILSMILELLRLMFVIYGVEQTLSFFNTSSATVDAPGVVAIDEVDAHLHPTWQRDIGIWLTKCFPKIQFIVTTHSPIACRAIATEEGKLRGSAWLLPKPGEQQSVIRVEGTELERLVFGNILDAFDTHLFGENVIRSEIGKEKLERLAKLNLTEIERKLSATELDELKELRRLFPGSALILPRG